MWASNARLIQHKAGRMISSRTRWSTVRAQTLRHSVQASSVGLGPINCLSSRPPRGIGPLPSRYGRVVASRRVAGSRDPPMQTSSKALTDACTSILGICGCSSMNAVHGVAAQFAGGRAAPAPPDQTPSQTTVSNLALSSCAIPPNFLAHPLAIEWKYGVQRARRIADQCGPGTPAGRSCQGLALGAPACGSCERTHNRMVRFLD